MERPRMAEIMKLPESCGTVDRHELPKVNLGYLGECRSCPEVAPQLSKVAAGAQFGGPNPTKLGQFGPNGCNVSPMLTNIYRSRLRAGVLAPP